MTKIIIFGGNGYLGGKLKEMYPGAFMPIIDIADPLTVRAVLDEVQPDVVINAAGKTGKPNVDWCEDHKEETLRGNVTGPLVLLEECMKRGHYLVHIGSGCIYTGPKAGGYTEEDEPNFTGSFYSLTKAMSDRLLRPFPVLQLRIRMPFDGTKSKRNLMSNCRCTCLERYLLVNQHQYEHLFKYSQPIPNYKASTIVWWLKRSARSDECRTRPAIVIDPRRQPLNNYMYV